MDPSIDKVIEFVDFGENCLNRLSSQLFFGMVQSKQKNVKNRACTIDEQNTFVPSLPTEITTSQLFGENTNSQRSELAVMPNCLFWLRMHDNAVAANLKGKNLNHCQCVKKRCGGDAVIHFFKTSLFLLSCALKMMSQMLVDFFPKQDKMHSCRNTPKMICQKHSAIFFAVCFIAEQKRKEKLTMGLHLMPCKSPSWWLSGAWQ